MRIALVVPYFGEFNNYFSLVLKSCEANKDLCDWIFFTDDTTPYNYPENVKVHYSTFEDIKEKIQSKFDFPVRLDRPYKFCDFRPMYGYVFKEYLDGYDFWGHCDIDCIFGKFSHFFNEDILQYDKVMRLGHLTLYRNTEKVNKAFMNTVQGVERYKEVLQTPKSCIFDEDNAAGALCICDIWREYGYTELTMDTIIANTNYKSNIFWLHYQKEKSKYENENKRKSIFYWTPDGLFRVFEENSTMETKEFLYIHLMRRDMKNRVNNLANISLFKIIPNSFENVRAFPQTVEEFHQERWRYFNLQYFKTRWRNLKTKVKSRLAAKQ